MIRKNNQSGQIALIALLVLTVATTVGLSLVARSTTDVSVTRNIEESSRAFSAAEAGIEEALKTGVGSSGTIDSSLGITYSVMPVPVAGGVGNPFVFPQPTLKEDTETVWLVNHDPATGMIIETPTYTANTITVCWGGSPAPAVVVSILYKTGVSYRVAKAAYDPDTSRTPPNNFSGATNGGCTANTAYKATINFPGLGINPDPDILIALRIRPVYNNAQIAVQPAQVLPVQGNNIESVGKAGADVNRKIVVYQQYRAPASIFDYAVYS
ncbi:MAG: pilus assembly PilX N-terminal domain-containing protein, partial [Candidatus Gottesmanbacteria bacterium]|nr:pilus assembly PilX N-terminal domain-containing protein [Candidatus Gottesmanbacteria bacterium]